MSKRGRNIVYAEDPIRPWFEVLEGMGEFTKIRFGSANTGHSGHQQEPKWIYRDHQCFDGIGGLIDVLREMGINYDSSDIPTTGHSNKDSWWPFLRGIPELIFAKRKRLDFLPPLQNSRPIPGKSLAIDSAPEAVAWHAFTESETSDIIKKSKLLGVTVNTLLIHTLDQTMRESLKDRESVTTWMLPINMRGAVEMQRETMNHSSCINIKLNSVNSFDDTHKTIYSAIKKKQHWQNWKGYVAGKWMSEKVKRKLLIEDKAMSQWNMGCFSNLGVWDSGKKLDSLDTWYFTPPVIECQRIAVGCITFQNKLSLTMQLHPLLSLDSEVARTWISDWVKRIKFNISK
ncbi:MAG: hypothetical protein ACSHX6_10960 [Akkermansiaceae bacterium]